MTTAATHFWDALAKITVLEKAARGDLLSEGDEAMLLQIADDYRPQIVIGHMRPITHHDVMEAISIIRDDVRMMTGQRRRNALLLLQRIDARGSRNITPKMLNVSQKAAELDEEMAREVDQDELAALGIG